MKNSFIISFSLCVMICTAQTSWSQSPSDKMKSSSMGSSEIEGMKGIESFPKTAPAPKTVLPEPVKPPTEIVQQAAYLHPGILVNVRGRWEGSDHLLNLSNNIGVYVALIKPEEETLSVTPSILQKEVETIFGRANIKPQTLAPAGSPPLPAFEIEIFVYPIDKGYAAFLEGRLFESVVLDRFKMDTNMAFQAITWEKQALIVSPKDKFEEQLIKNVQEIADAFAIRFQAYEALKKSAY